MSDISIKDKNQKLSYSIKNIKTFKLDSESSTSYAEALISVRNGSSDELKEFTVKIGTRPINSNLVEDFAIAKGEINNDPKGVDRRLLNDDPFQFLLLV
ncbi:hypothetical protein MCANPG14_01841 [Mycoplasmopsis canis PG 14]|uniref:hypothetical protein n=1 Tax=Mycoplasmopsis canis TaxID=29555 RepID=UPI00025ADBC3|nr:hypothetical protein [Mycoplasmopsis canis]EIE39780.1 hypothetical protein MCANPG14_01841 [Mycoplasmopsis canis PG 14]